MRCLTMFRLFLDGKVVFILLGLDPSDGLKVGRTLGRRFCDKDF
jgi:hypothetical protein